MVRNRDFCQKIRIFIKKLISSEFPVFPGNFSKNTTFRHNGTPGPLKKYSNSCPFRTGRQNVLILRKFLIIPQKYDFFAEKQHFPQGCRYLHKIRFFAPMCEKDSYYKAFQQVFQVLLWSGTRFWLKSDNFHENVNFSEIPAFLVILAKSAVFTETHLKCLSNSFIIAVF